MSKSDQADESDSPLESPKESQSVVPSSAGTVAGIAIQKLAKRKKSSKTELSAIADDLGVSPFEFLLHVVAADWEALGYPSETYTVRTQQGLEMEIDRISLSDRLTAAKEAAQYLHAKRRAVEISGDADGDPIEFVYKGDRLDLIRKARG